MASLGRAFRSNDPLHFSVRGPVNGRWQVLCDRMREPLTNATSREAAFGFAMLLAVDHPRSTVELVS